MGNTVFFQLTNRNVLSIFRSGRQVNEHIWNESFALTFGTVEKLQGVF